MATTDGGANAGDLRGGNGPELGKLLTDALMTIKAHARTFTLWTGSLLSLLIAGGFGEPVRVGRVDPRRPNPVDTGRSFRRTAHVEANCTTYPNMGGHDAWTGTSSFCSA